MEHAGTIDVMANLANSYIGMQDFARGAPLMEEALAMQRRALGDDHANTLNSMCDLAFACYQQGDCAQTELKFDEVRPMMQRALGDSLRRPLVSRTKTAQHAPPKNLFVATMTPCCRYVLLLMRARRVNEVQTLIATITDAFASVMGPGHISRCSVCLLERWSRSTAVVVSWRWALRGWHAWQACCEQVRGSHDVSHL